MTRTKFLSLVLIILFISCGEENKKNNPGKTTAGNNDTIPVTRTVINKKAVASYLISMGDPKLDRKFGVEIFETVQTFKFLLVMYHDGTIQNDTLTIPNFGIWPLVKVTSGNAPLSCIIGFLDNKNDFREYKMLSAKDDRLRLTTLKYYGVSASYK